MKNIEINDWHDECGAALKPNQRTRPWEDHVSPTRVVLKTDYKCPNCGKTVRSRVYGVREK
jgi:hypothetical protein